jgi:hypothetical protein
MPEEMLTDGFVTETFLHYARPLVGELPKYAVLDELEV